MPMTTLVFDAGLNLLMTEGLTLQTLKMLLLDASGGYIPGKDQQYVTAIGGAELTTDNYARQTITGAVSIVDTGLDRVGLTADFVEFPNLGPMSGGPTIGNAIVFAQKTDDTDSILIACLSGIGQAVNSFSTFVQFDPTGLLRLTNA